MPDSDTRAMHRAGSPVPEAAQAARLDAIAWAVFFIWVGVAMLVAVPWGWFLVATGALILAAQAGRWRIGVEVETFWIAGGTVFLAAGVWRLLDLAWPIAPLLLILFGVILLGKALSRAA